MMSSDISNPESDDIFFIAEVIWSGPEAGSMSSMDYSEPVDYQMLIITDGETWYESQFLDVGTYMEKFHSDWVMGMGDRKNVVEAIQKYVSEIST